MDRRGLKTRTRRKKDIIPIFRRVGIVRTKSGIMAPVEALYSRNKRANCIDIKGILGHASLEEFLNSMSSGVMIFPDEKETLTEKIAFGSLMNKITLGTCHWVWGEKFSKSSCGDTLRKSMWEQKSEDLLELDVSDHHVIWGEGDKLLAKRTDLLGKDAMDNSPDHTVYILNYQDATLGLVNLFGKLESQVYIGKTSLTSGFGLDGNELILIASTTKNQLLRINSDEYERFKMDSAY